MTIESTLTNIFSEKRVYIENQFNNSTAKLIKLDCTLTEDHGFSKQLSNFPLESGINVTEAVLFEPIKFTLTGIESDTPHGLTEQFGITGTALQTVPDFQEAIVSSLDDTNSKKLLLQFEQWFDFSTLLKVITNSKIYEYMMITDFRHQKNSKNKYALEYSISFQQVNLASIVGTSGNTIADRPRTIDQYEYLDRAANKGVKK
jgi:hypothetical protein